MENVRQFNPRDSADDDGINRTPPADIDAERALLAGLMHYPEAADEADGLTAEDFYRPAHQLVFDVLTQQIRAGAPTNPIALRAEIERIGRLGMVGGGSYLWDIAGCSAGGSVEYYADILREKTHLRAAENLAIRLRAAVAAGQDPAELNRLVDDYQQRRATAGTGPGHLTAALVQWDPFFATDFGAVQLLPGKLMAPGQQITLIGDGKAGKSLFTQEWAWRMATGQPFLGDKPQDPVSVLYVDAENGQEQIQERFLSFGAGPGRMGLLSYASFPPVRPLDTAAGGADLLSLATSVGAQIVVIDTVSRFISGPENDADTWLSLYRHTLLPLKRAGIGSIRLDHFGKDSTRGGRGSSAKTQDVDHVWELAAQGGGALSLKRTHTRTGIGPDHFALLRQAQRDGDSWRHGGTRHVLMTWEHGMEAVPGTVENIIAELDKAGVPNDWGNVRVRDKLAAMGVRASKEKIAEAVRNRKSRTNSPSPKPSPTLPGTTNAPPSPKSGEGHGETAGQSVPGKVPGSPETASTAPSFPRPPSQEGEGGAGPVSTTHHTKPLCDICQRPMDPDWHTRGYRTHLGCDPATGSYPDDPDYA